VAVYSLHFPNNNASHYHSLRSFYWEAVSQALRPGPAVGPDGPAGAVAPVLGIFLASVQHVDNGDVVARDAVDHQVVGMHDRLSRPIDATTAVQVGMLRQGLGGLFDGLVKTFGRVRVAITEVVKDGPQ